MHTVIAILASSSSVSSSSSSPCSVSRCLLVAVCCLISSLAFSNSTELQVHAVADGVYAIEGPLDNRSAENLGNNATFGFIVTNDGVVLIDSGGSAKGAEQLLKAIQSVTSKPVKWVINTGGQDHRWLGNGFFKERGAVIYASERAVEDQKARSQEQFNILTQLIGAENLAGTEAVYADVRFDQQLEIRPGGVPLLLVHAGQAHTPGDSFVWLHNSDVMFSGDIVYISRMLGINSYSNSRSWLQVFETMMSYKPAWVVPGHGPASPADVAVHDTHNYLVFIRDSVGKFMHGGGGIESVGSLDQSPYNYLKNFSQLAGRNAQKVYEEMEWE